MNYFIIELPLEVYARKGRKIKEYKINFNTFMSMNPWDRNASKKQFIKDLLDQMYDKPTCKRCFVRFVYFSRNNNSDLDNFTSIHKKYFLDAMQQYDLIPDDKTANIAYSLEEYGGIDKNNPRVEAHVTILE